MKCYNFEEIISDYLEGKISHSTKIEADKHLEQCSVCKSKLEDMKEIVASLNRLPKLKTSDDFNERLMERIEKHKSKKKFILTQFIYKHSQKISTAVAVLILFFGIFYVYNAVFPNMPNQKIATSEIQKDPIQNNTKLQPKDVLQKKSQLIVKDEKSDSSEIEKGSFNNKIKMVNQEK
ncbi:MAG: hypothetical protein U9N76_05385 [Candidatus Marinimicrobia bacterium]|nr:hypothetical protein [Candidatus Neomarinimicrobiota bacterium]